MRVKSKLSFLFVDPLNWKKRERYHAILRFGMVSIPCQIGRNGASFMKREGDMKTPRGVLRLIRGFWRADRRLPPQAGLPMRPIRQSDGWCDAPGHYQYNRLVKRPFAASHEELWRKDNVYDVVLELDWNSKPRVQGRGSAIFLHLIRQDCVGGTAGCIAVDQRSIVLLLHKITHKTRIIIR